MGLVLSTGAKLFGFDKAPTAGLIHHKTLRAQHQNPITSLRIQPGGPLLAAADELGSNLLFFDLPSGKAYPQQSCRLLMEQGGISELCWLGKDILAVGTTRGKILVFSCKNDTARFTYVCGVAAHGDGVSQISVDSMDFHLPTRKLASIGEGLVGLKLWDVDAEGTLTPCEIGDQSPEYSPPCFVGFSDDGQELTLCYLDRALVKRYALMPWRQLSRNYSRAVVDLPHTDEHKYHYIGNAVLLHQSQSLVLFNLSNGLDIYDMKTFTRKSFASFPVNPQTSQGVSLFRSGSLLACSASNGHINIISCENAKIVGRLRMPGRAPCIQAVSASDVVTSGAEYVVGASAQSGCETKLEVWRRRETHEKASHSRAVTGSDSIFRHIFLIIVVYFVCSSLQPLVGDLLGAKLKELTEAHGFSNTQTPPAVNIVGQPIPTPSIHREGLSTQTQHSAFTHVTTDQRSSNPSTYPSAGSSTARPLLVTYPDFEDDATLSVLGTEQNELIPYH